MSEPPFQYAVIRKSDSHVMYANGDLAGARREAEGYAMEDPEATFIVVQYVDQVSVVPMPKWTGR